MFNSGDPDIRPKESYTTHEEYILEMQAEENRKLKVQLRRNKRIRALAKEAKEKLNEHTDI